MPFGRRSPFEALAMPGVLLAYKYSQFRQRRREAASRRVTERELSALHHKIDKLLNKLEESEPEPPTSQEDECVICINARATMQTSPCGHRVVCRRCFVKTIQSAVAQRLLPLRCVICRARVNRLTSGTGSWRLQESASSYSMGTTKSWSVLGSSSSSYSVGANRVAQSASLYSMSSGSSYISGSSSMSNSSNSSGASAGVASSISGMSSTSSKGSCGDSLSRHHHGSTCGTNCSGAIPRNPQYSLHKRNSSYYHNQSKGRVAELQNRLPPIKEFRSPSKVPMPSPTHSLNPKIRFASYTQNSNSLNDNLPLLGESSSIKMTTLNSTQKLSGGIRSKVAPINGKTPINAMVAETNHKILSDKNFNKISSSSSNALPSSATSRGLILLSSNSKIDERADNRKNENAEKKKKEDKLKMKAEKEARKEEKRIAKEEERQAKLLAKEEKKKGKREAKELLLADGRKK